MFNISSAENNDSTSLVIRVRAQGQAPAGRITNLVLIIQPLRAFRQARLVGCPAWVLGKSSGIWAVLSLPLNQLGPSAPLPSPLGVL